ncbi:v-type proton atpase catalytic subunit a [Holotrichia oblita]|nr:v-type proton atpase catalytic subunit a [Holotrichia oblita]
MITGKIIKVSGPLVVAEGMREANMFDVVRVGEMQLIGEIIEMRGDRASIQVYEETAGIGPGDVVVSTGAPLSVELGPGLITNIYDGILRPLDVMFKKYGTNITKGINEPSLDREKKWTFVPVVEKGAKLVGGDIIGTVKETAIIVHKILVPPNVEGEITEIAQGEFTVADTVAKIKTAKNEIIDLTLMQKWAVRKARPYAEKLPPNTLMTTGQRSIDALFPVPKGGTACIPGPFGSGKTVVQHQLAKWSDVDVVVYIGCGERGNEMTDVLREFPELKDPRSGYSLMERTVLIANTSDMPIAAREASVYTGITLAEYFRDMGYSVAIMADSTSRWAEALREMSGRLEEMPGEEGYPAYLTSRLAQFYERAGRVVCLGSDKREATLTAIGAVSPTGGDLADPVVQATLRIVKVFWGLDANLAYQRHFPAINWLNSYSLYKERLEPWFTENADKNWTPIMADALKMLQTESELQEIVKLVGIDALSSGDRLLLEATRSIREDFLLQDAFSIDDSFSATQKQYDLMSLIMEFYQKAAKAVENGANIEQVAQLAVREQIGRAKSIPIDKYKNEYAEISKAIDEELNGLIS